MKVTNITLYSIHPTNNGVCAKAEVEIDSCMIARNIRVINGNKGLFIAFPNDGRYNLVNGEKRYNDVFYVKDGEKRKELQQMVINKYLQITNQEVE